MPDNDVKVTPPVIGKKRAATIDAIADDAETGGDKLSQVLGTKPRHPAASKPATPERNSTYDDMEARIYGDKSAKAKR